MLEVKNLNIRYLYGALAVKNLSFSLNDGETLAVYSGADGGKTSLIKCLAGLVPAESGTVFLDGKDITREKPRSRDFSVIYENEGVFNYKSVKFHLEYPLKLRKVKSEEIKRAVAETAERFSLYPLLGDIGNHLSAETKVRLSFARAHLRKAGLYLADNPFNSLKKRQREELFREMLADITDIKPLIFATDSTDEALTLGDKILVLNYGITEQLDTPENILNYPKTLYVDKTFHPYKTRTETEIIKKGDRTYGTVILNTEIIFRLDTEIAEDSLTASFYVKEDRNGAICRAEGFIFSGGGRVAILDGGYYLRTDEKKESYAVTPEIRTLNLFSKSSEKRLTTEIL